MSSRSSARPSRTWFVVSDPADDVSDDGPTAVLSADAYLQGTALGTLGGGQVVNVCRDHAYLSAGYYVSLIADARGQHVEPTIDTIVALQDAVTVQRRLLELGLAAGDASGEAHPVRIHGGTVVEARYRTLARALYRAFPHPLLEAEVVRTPRGLRVRALRSGSYADLDASERARLRAAYGGRPGTPARSQAVAYSLAVLHDPADPHAPSNRDALHRLRKVAKRMGVAVEVLGLDDIARVADHDALFVRTLTGVDEPSFAFVQRAASLGMPVVDDPHSILRCCNKVYLHELLRRAGVPTPPTRVVAPGVGFDELAEALGVPFVVKQPDGSFSSGVKKIETAEAWTHWSEAYFAHSPLLVVQAFMPTAFDWRIGVLGGRPLFAARYHMAAGHWQIVAGSGRGVRYGRVEAVPRSRADAEVVAVACTAAGILGDGLYGVDLKDTPDGVVVIEVNDNPNLDFGQEDAADGEVIYEDLLRYFGERVDRANRGVTAAPPADRGPLRAPIDVPGPSPSVPYRAYEVVGIELEYPIVDDRLEPLGAVAEVLRDLAGRPTSDVDLGAVGMSNEIVDHVLELKTTRPLARLVDSELVLAELVRRVAVVLSERGARLLPTAMHPWLDPTRTRLWSRSGRRIYTTYERLFDVRTHGWANVQAMHVNLPVGSDADAVAMMNAARLLVPYLPAIAASSPMYDGKLMPAVDNRLAWIVEHQARIPESCGDIVPEPIGSLQDYRQQVLAPMYAAVDRLPDAGLLRREYFNARGAVFKFSRHSMEVRVLDTQECVHMDHAIAAFVRHGLRWLASRPAVAVPQALLVEDFRAVVAQGSAAEVHAPHLLAGGGSVREALQTVLDGAMGIAPADERPYLDRVGQILREGSLSERIAAALRPAAGDPQAMGRATRRVYDELAVCLAENRPWAGRAVWSA